MANPKGLFDPIAVPAGWFAKEGDSSGWFDSSLITTSGGASNTAINPGVGSIAITGYAPSISQTAVAAGFSQSYYKSGSESVNNWIVNGVTFGDIRPNSGSLSITGYAPSIGQTQSASPGAGSLTITGYAPSIAQPQAVLPSVGSLSITGYAPTVAQSTSTPIGLFQEYRGRGSELVNTWNAGLSLVNITPGAGSLSITGYAPTVAQTTTAAAIGLNIDYRSPGSTNAIVWTGDGLSLNGADPATGTITITGYAPTVSQSSPTAVNPAVGSLVITGYAPTIAQPQGIAPVVGSLAITGYAPTVSQTSGVTYTGLFVNYLNRGSSDVTLWTGDGLSTNGADPATGTLTITGYAPTVTQGGTSQAVNPGAGSLAITGYSPTIAQTTANNITPGAGSLVITGYAPTVVNSGVSTVNTGPGFYMRKFALKRGQNLLVFDNKEQAEAFEAAEEAANRVIKKAKRLPETKSITVDFEPQVIDTQALQRFIGESGLPFDLPALINQRAIEEIVRIHLIALQVQEEEDILALLL